MEHLDGADGAAQDVGLQAAAYDLDHREPLGTVLAVPAEANALYRWRPLSVDDYAGAEPDPLAPHAIGIVGHMNADHAGALVELAHAYAGRVDVTAARMTAVDRYGFEVVADVTGPRQQAAFRVGFRTPQSAPDGVRQELVGMLHAARASGSAQPAG